MLLNNREVFPPVQSVGLLLEFNRLADHAEFFSIDFFYNETIYMIVILYNHKNNLNHNTACSLNLSMTKIL